MAVCPKCEYKLKLYDVSQYCPKCGVNINYYNFEQNFYREAKYAELSQAGFSAKIKRLVASFIGCKLTIARLCVMLLPLLSLLIPAFSINLSFIIHDVEMNLNAIGFYNIFTDGTFNLIGELTKSDIFGGPFSSIQYILFAYVVTALFAVFTLLTMLLGFISIKNMQKISATTSVLGFVSAVATQVLCYVSKTSSSISSCKAGFGLYVTMLMFIATFVVSFLLIKNEIPVKYDEGVLERIEIFKKVKNNEISLDDLPQPVVETEETRKIDLEIEAEKQEYLKNHAEDTEVAE